MKSPDPGLGFSTLFFGALVCYVLALTLRLFGLMQSDLQPDERLWVERSARIAKLLSVNPGQATTHLGQPGVTPALIMAVGIYAAEHYNGHFELFVGDPGYIYPIDAARAAAAGVSALVAPAVFLGSVGVFGLVPALTAGALIALDPRHIGYSRMAHLDAVLTLLVLLTILLYRRSVANGQVSLKLAAGFCWGLAVATKPTAGVLLPVFVVFKGLRSLIGDKQGERSLISWSDFGAFLVGHAAFGLIYTRLWYHLSEYRERLHIRIHAGRIFWQLGSWLKDHALLTTLLVAATLLGSWLLWKSYRKRKGRLSYHGAMLLLFCGLIGASLAVFPQVFENLARFWKWAASLSGETHQAFGRTIAPLDFGYWWFFVSETPVLVLIGMLFSLWFLVKASRQSQTEAASFILLCLACALLWILPLTVSSKQAWRYALPVVPCFSIAAAFGWTALLGSVAKRFANVRILPIGATTLVLAQLLVSLSWFPHYQIFCNSVTGGLTGAIVRGQGVPFAGQRAVIDFAVNEARDSGERIFVTVEGDAAAMTYAYRRFYPETGVQVRFADFKPRYSNFVVVFASRSEVIDEYNWRSALQKPPVFQEIFKGAAIVKVFKSPYPTYDKPVTLSAKYAYSQTGRKSSLQPGKVGIIAVDEGMDDPGFVMFDVGYRVLPGTYRFTVPLRLVEPFATLEVGSVIGVDLAPLCSTAVSAVELTPGSFKDFSVLCRPAKPMRLVPQVEWLGKGRIMIGSAVFEKVD